MRQPGTHRTVFAITLLLYAHASDGRVCHGDEPREQFRVLLQEAEGRGDERPAYEYAGRFVHFAQKHGDDPTAFDALVWVVRNCRSSADAEKAIDLLARDYARSPRFRAVCGALIYSHPANEKLLRAVLDRNPDHEVRGLACVSLARKLEFESDIVGALKTNPEGVERARPSYSKQFMDWYCSRDPVAMKKEANELFERAAAEFGIAPIELGRPAPEIEGLDAHGKPFRLSDYRGKVVLLTFSGNWCKPCRAMYPMERRIADTLSEEAFSIVSVSTDFDKSTLLESLESGEITWRCWWDGPPGGPIATRWGVAGYPSLFLIDAQGVVRHRYDGVPEEGQLEEGINSLLGGSKK